MQTVQNNQKVDLNNIDIYPDELKFYKKVKILGQGAYGVVCLYQDKIGNKVAVKFEDSRIHAQVLTAETLILKDILRMGTKFIPQYIDHGMKEWRGLQFNFLVMEIIDQSIEDYINAQPQTDKDKQFDQLFIKMVEAVQELHQHFYIHRDIKPENFRVKNNQVYLIDFGISKKYIENGKWTIQCGKGRMTRGTPLFISINQHDTQEQSRLDDLISLAYSMLYISRGQLPWQTLTDQGENQNMNIFQQQKMQMEQIRKLKEQIKESDFDTDRDKRLFALIKYLNEQNSNEKGFSDEPNYEYIKHLILTPPVEKLSFHMVHQIDIVKDKNIVFRKQPGLQIVKKSIELSAVNDIIKDCNFIYEKPPQQLSLICKISQCEIKQLEISKIPNWQQTSVFTIDVVQPKQILESKDLIGQCDILTESDIKEMKDNYETQIKTLRANYDKLELTIKNQMNQMKEQYDRNLSKYQKEFDKLTKELQTYQQRISNTNIDFEPTILKIQIMQEQSHEFKGNSKDLNGSEMIKSSEFQSTYSEIPFQDQPQNQSGMLTLDDTLKQSEFNLSQEELKNDGGLPNVPKVSNNKTFNFDLNQQNNQQQDLIGNQNNNNNYKLTSSELTSNNHNPAIEEQKIPKNDNDLWNNLNVELTININKGEIHDSFSSNSMKPEFKKQILKMYTNNKKEFIMTQIEEIKNKCELIMRHPEYIDNRIQLQSKLQDFFSKEHFYLYTENQTMKIKGHKFFGLEDWLQQLNNSKVYLNDSQMQNPQNYDEIYTNCQFYKKIKQFNDQLAQDNKDLQNILLNQSDETETQDLQITIQPPNAFPVIQNTQHRTQQKNGSQTRLQPRKTSELTRRSVNRQGTAGFKQNEAPAKISQKFGVGSTAKLVNIDNQKQPEQLPRSAIRVISQQKSSNANFKGYLNKQQKGKP